MGRHYLLAAAVLAAACGAGRTEPLDSSGIQGACSSLRENDCEARSDCQAQRCTGCGPTGFVGCVRAGDDEPQCPLIYCQPPRCEDLDEQGCIDWDDCHAVYREPSGACNCDAIGCCSVFDACKAPGRAQCDISFATCRRTAPECEPGWSPSIVDGCYEGCVLSSECLGAP